MQSVRYITAAVQKIGQYKMESMAKEKAGMLYSGGNGNPSTGGGGDGAAELQNEYNALSSQGILAGTEYEYYKPFDDAPEYEEYKEVPTWLKAVAGVAVAAVVGLAVGALVVATGGLAAAALGVTAVQLGMTKRMGQSPLWGIISAMHFGHLQEWGDPA